MTIAQSRPNTAQKTKVEMRRQKNLQGLDKDIGSMDGSSFNDESLTPPLILGLDKPTTNPFRRIQEIREGSSPPIENAKSKPPKAVHHQDLKSAFSRIASGSSHNTKGDHDGYLEQKGTQERYHSRQGVPAKPSNEPPPRNRHRGGTLVRLDLQNVHPNDIDLNGIPKTRALEIKKQLAPTSSPSAHERTVSEVTMWPICDANDNVVNWQGMKDSSALETTNSVLNNNFNAFQPDFHTSGSLKSVKGFEQRKDKRIDLNSISTRPSALEASTIGNFVQQYEDFQRYGTGNAFDEESDEEVEENQENKGYSPHLRSSRVSKPVVRDLPRAQSAETVGIPDFALPRLPENAQLPEQVNQAGRIPTGMVSLSSSSVWPKCQQLPSFMVHPPSKEQMFSDEELERRRRVPLEREVSLELRRQSHMTTSSYDGTSYGFGEHTARRNDYDTGYFHEAYHRRRQEDPSPYRLSRANLISTETDNSFDPANIVPSWYGMPASRIKVRRMSHGQGYALASPPSAAGLSPYRLTETQDDESAWQTEVDSSVGDSFRLQNIQSIQRGPDGKFNISSIQSFNPNAIHRTGDSIADHSDTEVEDLDQYGSTTRIAQHPAAPGHTYIQRERRLADTDTPVLVPEHGYINVNGWLGRGLNSLRNLPRPARSLARLSSWHLNPFLNTPPSIGQSKTKDKHRDRHNYSYSNNVYRNERRYPYSNYHNEQRDPYSHHRPHWQDEVYLDGIAEAAPSIPLDILPPPRQDQLGESYRPREMMLAIPAQPVRAVQNPLYRTLYTKERNEEMDRHAAAQVSSQPTCLQQYASGRSMEELFGTPTLRTRSRLSPAQLEEARVNNDVHQWKSMKILKYCLLTPITTWLYALGMLDWYMRKSSNRRFLNYRDEEMQIAKWCSAFWIVVLIVIVAIIVIVYVAHKAVS